jgi:uncharacterized membrane protein
MPGLIKIGMTTRTFDARMSELYNTSTPTPFVLEIGVNSIEPYGLEQLLHRRLARYRVSRDREFFAIEMAELKVMLAPLLNEGVITVDDLFGPAIGDLPGVAERELYRQARAARREVLEQKLVAARLADERKAADVIRQQDIANAELEARRLEVQAATIKERRIKAAIPWGAVAMAAALSGALAYGKGHEDGYKVNPPTRTSIAVQPSAPPPLKEWELVYRCNSVEKNQILKLPAEATYGDGQLYGGPKGVEQWVRNRPHLLACDGHIPMVLGAKLHVASE